MKKAILSFTFLFFSINSFAEGKKSLQDSHSTIYTTKIKRVVNAINVGEFSTDKEYLEMLKTACDRNQCSNLESQTIQSVGQQIVQCQISHLKSHGIDNPDATYLCQSKQAILGCDTLATPLLRKMCYTGNKYSLKVFEQKEKSHSSKQRLPASK